MEITARKIERTTIPEGEYFELFVADTLKDINGNDVIIPRSIGRYSLVALEAQKVEIQAKIDAINALQ